MAKRLLQTAALSTTVVIGYCNTCDVYAGPLGGAIRRLDGETAHNLGLSIARLGIIRPGGLRARADSPRLRTKAWHMDLSSPIGLAAGFDKDAVAMKGLFALGFAAVEIGSVTPKPQPGNARPRVFRLLEDRAIINRYGFNSAGVKEVKNNLVKFDFGGRAAGWVGAVGVNIGKNKDTPDERAVDDYVTAVRELGDHADYLVINVSSPNTPGLRALQGKAQLRALLGPVLAARDELRFRPPVMLKIAPDLSDADKADIAEIVLELAVDGLIVSNTTVARPETLSSEHASEVGGLSGLPLRDMSTRVLADMYRLTGGQVMLVGVGGVESGQDAYDKIRAGAHFVQLYSALVFNGPWLVYRVKQELDALLERDGYDSPADAVGADHKAAKTDKSVDFVYTRNLTQRPVTLSQRYQVAAPNIDNSIRRRNNAKGFAMAYPAAPTATAGATRFFQPMAAAYAAEVVGPPTFALLATRHSLAPIPQAHLATTATTIKCIIKTTAPNPRTPGPAATTSSKRTAAPRAAKKSRSAASANHGARTRSAFAWRNRVVPSAPTATAATSKPAMAGTAAAAAPEAAHNAHATITGVNTSSQRRGRNHVVFLSPSQQDLDTSKSAWATSCTQTGTEARAPQ